MSTLPETGPESELGAMAMDYALGGLSRAERKAAGVRLVSYAQFRDAVTRWQTVLSQLDEATAPEAPPPGLWDAIVADVQPAPRPVTAAASTAARGWWHNLMLWRAVGIGGPLLAAITVVLLAMPPVPDLMVSTDTVSGPDQAKKMP